MKISELIQTLRVYEKTEGGDTDVLFYYPDPIIGDGPFSEDVFLHSVVQVAPTIYGIVLTEDAMLFPVQERTHVEDPDEIGEIQAEGPDPVGTGETPSSGSEETAG